MGAQRGGVMRWSMGDGTRRACWGLFALLWTNPVTAAELRIEWQELAAIARQMLGAATLRLHNAPAQGLIDFSSGSSVTFGAAKVAIPLPVRTFTIAGGTYAYYANDINSTRVSVEPVPGAVRLTLHFEGEESELVGRCRAGLCPPANALPRIEWTQASVAIDLAPVKVEDSLSLEARAVRIGGAFAPTCAPDALISGGICKSVLARARTAIARLKGDLDGQLRAEVNKPDIQAKIAGALRQRLVLGPAGEVRIRGVEVTASAVTLSFCLACGS